MLRTTSSYHYNTRSCVKRINQEVSSTIIALTASPKRQKRTAAAVLNDILSEATAAVTCSICYRTTEDLGDNNVLVTNGCQCGHPICAECLISARLGNYGYDFHFRVMISRPRKDVVCSIGFVPPFRASTSPREQLMRCHNCREVFENRGISIYRLPQAHLKWMDVYRRLMNLPSRKLTCEDASTRVHATDWKKIQCGCIRLPCPACKDPTLRCSIEFDTQDGDICWVLNSCKQQFCPCPWKGCDTSIALSDIESHFNEHHPDPFPMTLTTSTNMNNIEVESEAEEDEPVTSELDLMCTVCATFREVASFGIPDICRSCTIQHVTNIEQYSTVMVTSNVEGFYCVYCQIHHLDQPFDVIDFRQGVANLVLLCAPSVAFMLSYIVGDNKDEEFPLLGIRDRCFDELKKHIPEDLPAFQCTVCNIKYITLVGGKYDICEPCGMNVTNIEEYSTIMTTVNRESPRTLAFHCGFCNLTHILENDTYDMIDFSKGLAKDEEYLNFYHLCAPSVSFMLRYLVGEKKGQEFPFAGSSIKFKYFEDLKKYIPATA